jgi:hypothetical protein
MKYVLSSAVITGPGVYEYRLVHSEDARRWLKAGGWVSTVGYVETAEALSLLTGVHVPHDRRTCRMESGDEALVFRLVLPPGARRVEPIAKGAVGQAYVLEHCEIGILNRQK